MLPARHPAWQSLTAYSVWIRFWPGEWRSRPKVSQLAYVVANEIANPRRTLPGDVLRLVRHHVVVDVPRRRAEERHGDAEAREHVMIAPTIGVGRVAVFVELIVERESIGRALIHLFHHIAELRRQAARANHHQRVVPAGWFVVRVTATHLVHVDVRDDRIARYRRVVGVIQ